MKLILNYTDFLTFIKEGYNTYNIYQYQDNIHIQLVGCGIENLVEIINKFSYNVTIFNPKCLLDNNIQISLFSTNNLLGYFPSHMILYKTNLTFGDLPKDSKFDLKELLEKITLGNITKIKIKFEGLYDDGLYKNNIDVPDICYHLSPIEYKNKILKIGLYPKSKNRITTHPERIFLFQNYNDYNILLANLKTNDKKTLGYSRIYNLYEIQMDKNIILHTDPNFMMGFFTYDNISPKNIKISLENI